MAIRLANRRGRMLTPPEVERLARAVLLRFPHPPDGAQLTAFLADRTSVLVAPSAVPDLCHLRDLDEGELAWFADVQGRERRTSGALQHYRWWTLPKRDGVRLVAAPKPRLKEIQRRVLRHVLADIPSHEAAHGGVPAR